MVKYFSLSQLLLSAYLIRMLIVGSSIGDAVVIFALAALEFGTYYYKGHRELPINSDVLDRIVYLEEQLKTTKDKVNSMSFGAHLKK